MKRSPNHEAQARTAREDACVSDLPTARRRTDRRPSRTPIRTQGMTLIELMVVVVLAALATSGMTFALGALTRTQLRSACVRVIAASRYAYNRAIVQGSTVRVVFDLSKNEISIEEAPGNVTLVRTSLSKGDDKKKGENDEAGVDPWAAAQASLESTIKPSLGKSPFGPIENEEGAALSRFKPKALGDGIRIVRVFSPHDPVPRRSGRGTIYFFPGGLAEHAVVQLADRGGRIYSVEIHPLTGRGKVYAKAYAPEEISEETLGESGSELRDDG